jgi:transcriptional regulator with XRE-family HTH domain
MIGGELVREARKRAGITQDELARRAESSQPAIARLESGRTSPSLEQVQRLMRLCGFELLVELAPYDDSDRLQAGALTHLSPQQRAALNAATVDQADELRRAFADARPA